jgi:uridylate kinase
MKYKRILLKISGESLKQKQTTILDSKFVSSLCKQISELAEQGVQIGIVIGGGNM